MLCELGYSVQGLLNKDIAVQLGITDATIKVHKARVMEKMRVDSLQGLVKSYLKASLDQSLPTQ
jgi:FixJ family two-component response regulator